MANGTAPTTTARPEAQEYLIWCTDVAGWWTNEAVGYTTDLDRAARWDRDAAMAIALNLPDRIAVPLSRALESGPPVEAQEPTYPCKDCGALRTEAEGGTTFTVCDECWDKIHKPKRKSTTPPDYQADVRAFHEALVPDQVADRPTMPPEGVINLRLDLIEEEFGELWAAFHRGDLVAVADALADLLYVTYGTAVACGIEIAPIWREVHRSNMAKEGGPTRADGKILKPEGWTPPDVRGELIRQGWRDPADAVTTVQPTPHGTGREITPLVIADLDKAIEHVRGGEDGDE